MTAAAACAHVPARTAPPAVWHTHPWNSLQRGRSVRSSRHPLIGLPATRSCRGGRRLACCRCENVSNLLRMQIEGSRQSPATWPAHPATKQVAGWQKEALALSSVSSRLTVIVARRAAPASEVPPAAAACRCRHCRRPLLYAGRALAVTLPPAASAAGAQRNPLPPIASCGTVALPGRAAPPPIQASVSKTGKTAEVCAEANDLGAEGLKACAEVGRPLPG